MTPMMSDSFMMMRSSPSILISVPDHFPVAGLDAEGVQHALDVARAGSCGNDFALHRLFLRRIGDDDAAGGRRLRLDTADQDVVLQRTHCHGWPPRTRMFENLALSDRERQS